MNQPSPNPGSADNTPALLKALAQVAQWREQAEASATHQMAELDSEEARVTAAIHDLRRRLTVLERRRGELRDATQRLEEEEIRRSHDAVLAALRQDQEVLNHRSEQLRALQAAARARADELLQNADIQSALRDYESFAEVEATLSGLPPSYRRAILAHHDQVRRQLEPLFNELTGANASLNMAQATVSVVAALEPATGPAEALALVTPVPAELYTGWDGRPMDLPAALAYRLVAAVAELAARLGVPDAPISYRPFEGYLAIQLWLGRQPLRGDVREVATAVLERVRTKATDMASAQLDVLVMWLPSEVLVSEEEEEEDNDTEGDSMVMQEFSPSNHVEPDGASDFLIADPGSEA